MDNKQSELSKSITWFIKNDLADVLYGCFGLIAFAIFFGWSLGGCYVLEMRHVIEAENRGIAPISSGVERK